ncbi:MAG: hypothetical protein ACLFPS_05540 [Clostridia bacterium]
MINFDDREQVVLAIDFGKTTTKLALLYLETEKGIEYISDSGSNYSSSIEISKNNGEVSVLGDSKAPKNQHSLVFSSIYDFIDTEDTWKVDNFNWNKIDFLAAALEEIKDFILTKISNIKIIRTIICIDFATTMKYKKYFKRAAEVAGLKAVEVFSHPIAVFKHLKNEVTNGKYLHLDYGHSTLNIYQVILQNQIVTIDQAKVYKTDQIDIDKELYEYLHQLILKQSSQNFSIESVSEEGKNSLKENIDKIKKDFKRRPSSEINVRNYGEVIGFKSIVFYKDIKHLFEAKYNQILTRVKEIAKDNSINAIVCSGGAIDQELIEFLDNNLELKLIYNIDKTKWLATLGCLDLGLDRGNYVISEKYNLILSDQSHFEVIKRYTPIDKIDELVYLSLVEDAAYAQIVIESNGNREVIKVPSYGFLQETIVLELFIDQDYKLTIKAGSDKLPMEKRIEKKYDNIKMSYNYEIDGDQNGE